MNREFLPLTSGQSCGALKAQWKQLFTSHLYKLLCFLDKFKRGSRRPPCSRVLPVCHTGCHRFLQLGLCSPQPTSESSGTAQRAQPTAGGHPPLCLRKPCRGTDKSRKQKLDSCDVLEHGMVLAGSEVGQGERNQLRRINTLKQG